MPSSALQAEPGPSRLEHPIHAAQESPASPSRSKAPAFPCTWEGCTKVFNRAAKLDAHLNVHTGARPFRCQHEGCQAAYRSQSKLQEHVRSHLPEHERYASRRFACEAAAGDGSVCGKLFDTRQHLRVHMQGVHDVSEGEGSSTASGQQNQNDGAKQYKCNEPGCDQSFAKRKRLRQHIWDVHSDRTAAESYDAESSTLARLPFACAHSDCDKRFPTASKRRSHYKRQHEENRYMCTLHDEGINFPTWSALQSHMKEAHPPTCPYPSCHGKVFKNAENLRGHVRRHEEREAAALRKVGDGEDGGGGNARDDDDEDHGVDDGGQTGQPRLAREYACTWRPEAGGAEGDSLCSKRFKSAFARDTHVRVAHLKERPFACECGKSYGHKHLLKRHVAKCRTHVEHSDAGPGGASSPVASDLASDEEDEVFRRGGGALPDALRDQSILSAALKRKRTGPQSRRDETSMVDLLTGRGYGAEEAFAGQSGGGYDEESSWTSEGNKRARRMRGRVVACPWSKFCQSNAEESAGQGEEVARDRSDGPPTCNVRFSRIYDLRRHLRSKHGVEADDGEIRRLLGEEELEKLAKPRRQAD